MTATKTEIQNLIQDNVGPAELAQFLTAPWGWVLGLYADGSVHIGDSVGAEIDPNERPIVTARCPGIGNIDTTWCRTGWDCEDLDDAEVIIDCCENGDVEDELKELHRRLVSDIED
jgi:hypothetical protein